MIWAAVWRDYLSPLVSRKDQAAAASRMLSRWKPLRPHDRCVPDSLIRNGIRVLDWPPSGRTSVLRHAWAALRPMVCKSLDLRDRRRRAGVQH